MFQNSVFSLNRTNEQFSILSWNINGKVGKLENNSVWQFLINYDIIFLNELKTNHVFSIPGIQLQGHSLFQKNTIEEAYQLRFQIEFCLMCIR